MVFKIDNQEFKNKGSYKIVKWQCQQCALKKELTLKRAELYKFCSLPCYWKSKIGKNHGNGSKIGDALRGKPKSKEHIRRVAEALRGRKRPDLSGSNHPFWIGDRIKYAGVHDWITMMKGKACTLSCELKDRTCKGMMDWSNKSGKYRRRLYDWWTLCRSHHRRYDYGRNK